jgi:predicted RNA-binding protein YlxR (DUF448 family)
VRLALDDAVSVKVDRSQRMPGRGAYVCSQECFTQARSRGGLQRAFRRHLPADSQTVESVG